MSCDVRQAGGGSKKTKSETDVNQKFAVKMLERMSARMHVGRRCRRPLPGGPPCCRGWCSCCSCCRAASRPVARAAKRRGGLGERRRGCCASCAAKMQAVHVLRWHWRCVVVVEHAMARASHAPTLVCALARRVQHVVQHAERHRVCRVHACYVRQAMRWAWCDGMCHVWARGQVRQVRAPCSQWQEQGEGWKTRWAVWWAQVGRRPCAAGNRSCR